MYKIKHNLFKLDMVLFEIPRTTHHVNTTSIKPISYLHDHQYLHAHVT